MVCQAFGVVASQANVVNFFYVLVCLWFAHPNAGRMANFDDHQSWQQNPSLITSFISPKALIRAKMTYNLPLRLMKSFASHGHAVVLVDLSPALAGNTDGHAVCHPFFADCASYSFSGNRLCCLMAHS